MYSNIVQYLLIKDYVIHVDSSRGWVTVAGIRSTGLSCSLAISRYIAAALLPDHEPRDLPEMPAPRLTRAGDRVRIGDKLYTPTHPLTRLGLLGAKLPQTFLSAAL